MRSSSFDLALLTLLVAGIAYFVVDGWFGPSGRSTLTAIERAIQQEEAVIAELTLRRDALKHKTDALSGDAIDADLFDEAARAAFGLGTKDEVLILKPAAE